LGTLGVYKDLETVCSGDKGLNTNNVIANLEFLDGKTISADTDSPRSKITIFAIKKTISVFI